MHCADGLLIYNTMGPGAYSSFTTSWGISYSMDQVTQWKDIFQEAVKGIIILAILERLQLTRHTDWLEARAHASVLCVPSAHCVMPLTRVLAQAHLDFLSLQANMFTARTFTFWEQIRMLVHNQRRLAAE